jgi:hypothetical protein
VHKLDWLRSPRDCKSDLPELQNFLSPGDKYPEQPTSRRNIVLTQSLCHSRVQVIKTRPCFVLPFYMNVLYNICSREHVIISEIMFCVVNCTFMSVCPKRYYKLSYNKIIICKIHARYTHTYIYICMYILHLHNFVPVSTFITLTHARDDIK